MKAAHNKKPSTSWCFNFQEANRADGKSQAGGATDEMQELDEPKIDASHLFMTTELISGTGGPSVVNHISLAEPIFHRYVRRFQILMADPRLRIQTNMY